jgi:hypothetical protein
LFRDTTTLGEARQWLLDNRESGVRCPCCTRYIKVYHRKLNAGMAHALIALWRKGGTTEVIHLNSTVSSISHEAAQLSWWGMIEQKPSDRRREDEGRGSWWSVTGLGEQFALNKILVSKHVWVYRGKVLGYDDAERISIIEALGDAFDYQELMDQ